MAPLPVTQMDDGTTAPYDSGYFENLREEMLPFLPSRVRRMLDIGCGEGVFGAVCKSRFGCEAWGVEINSRAAELAVSRLDRVLAGDAYEHARTLPDRHFDLIVCNDVLEHLAEPELLLAELRRTLTSGGCVVASIPNIRYYLALWTILVDKDFPRHPHGIFDRTHLRFFTRKTIERCFSEAGYSIERLSGINLSHDRRLLLLNLLLFGALNDCRYAQFACVARPRDHGLG